MRKHYPSDISLEQFEQIRPLLEGARKKTHPRKVSLHEIFCAVLYVLKSGCQWRMLPSDFPKWQNVYSHFRIWNQQVENKDSILEEILKKMHWKGPRQPWSAYGDQLINR